MEDLTMKEPIESLATRRSRRSTAGNRMEAALAEMALDTTVDSMDDDRDFVNDKEEEDVFGSDFASTDEENQEDLDAGEKAVQEEERRAKKDARSRVEKATAAAHARQKVTFNPRAEASSSQSKPKDLKRRVSLGPAVNAETGEVLPVGPSSPKKKRHSQRRHTILATSAAAERLKRSEEKKAAMPKKAKVESKVYTQAELIALALDNEEGNIVEHRDYLKVEEERRKRARVVRTAIEGPLIRWISRAEEIKVAVPPPPAPIFTPGRTGLTYHLYGGAMGSTPYGQTMPYVLPTGVYPHMTPSGYLSGYPVAPMANTSIPVPGSTSASDFVYKQPSQQASSAQPATDPAQAATVLLSAQSSSAQSATQQVSRPAAQSAAPETMHQLTPQTDSQSTSHPTTPRSLTQSTATVLQPANPIIRTTSDTIPPPTTPSEPRPTSQPVVQLTTPSGLPSTSQSSTPSVSQQGSQSVTSATSPNASYQTHYNPYMAQLQSAGAMVWTPPPLAPIERIEKVTKNYVVHELAQRNGVPKPLWNETMTAMFGDHVDWSEIKVFVGKNRPISRPKQTCTITGKEAKYVDPRTGVPYADLKAYEVLTKLLGHEYAWDPRLGCYVGQDNAGSTSCP
ncbi:hypothetical protein C0992_003385 [Termitomyces sp. T32_za158]|nr:hypothetical protein C0992_003385 [Termitomyces sp. T32_za158]